MLNRIINSVKNVFSKDKPKLVSIQVSEEVLRERFKGERDFKLKTTPEGAVSAFCKSCREDLKLVEKDGLIWFCCEVCQRVSFYPKVNLERDMFFAQKDGKPFEYELFFMEPPSELIPPKF